MFSAGVAVVGTGDACLNELIIRATPRKFDLLLVGQGLFTALSGGHFGNNLSLEQIMGFPTPKVFVTADSVIKGKPDPEGYLLARTLLNIPNDAAVLVVEDAPAGIRAGKTANCDVVGLLTTHKRVEVQAAGPDFVLNDLEHVEFVGVDQNDGGILVRIGNPKEELN